MSSSDREQSLANAIRAANGGCPQAYDSLLSELAGVLRAMARRALARSPEVDVEDVVQECLLAIHLKRHTWDEQRALLPWVRAIAHHKIVDSVRRRVRANEVLIEPLVESLLAPTAPGSAALPRLASHLRELPPRQRSVVIALAIRGESISEAARELCISSGAVRIALHRGLAALRHRFTDWDR